MTENLHRFLEKLGHLKNEKTGVRKSAFLFKKQKEPNKLSVYREDLLEGIDLWDASFEFFSKMRGDGRIAEATAILEKPFVSSINGLSIEPLSTPHPAHANIVTSLDGATAGLIAIELANHARPKLNPHADKHREAIKEFLDDR